jgi:hypothetical protein
VGLKNQDVEIQIISQEAIESIIKDAEKLRSFVSSIPISGSIAVAITDKYFFERYKKKIKKINAA